MPSIQTKRAPLGALELRTKIEISYTIRVFLLTPSQTSASKILRHQPEHFLKLVVCATTPGACSAQGRSRIPLKRIIVVTKVSAPERANLTCDPSRQIMLKTRITRHVIRLCRIGQFDACNVPRVSPQKLLCHPHRLRDMPPSTIRLPYPLLNQIPGKMSIGRVILYIIQTILIEPLFRFKRHNNILLMKILRSIRPYNQINSRSSEPPCFGLISMYPINFTE